MFSRKPWLLFIFSRPTLQYTLIKIYVFPVLLRFREDAYAIIAANIVGELLPLRQEHMFPQVIIWRFALFNDTTAISKRSVIYVNDSEAYVTSHSRKRVAKKQKNKFLFKRNL